LTGSERASLASGEVVVRDREPPNGQGVAFEALGIIRVSPGRLWPVLQACDRFQEFMPRTKKSRIKNRVGNTAVCFTKIGMPFPFDDLWSEVKVTETVHGDGTYSRSWTLLRGTFDRNEGIWQLYPWAGGKQTLMVYRLAVNPKISIPDFIIRKGQTGALPDMFEAINRRVRL
jgi:ribosome-associated toxin RatA of RatAB toxin-antitoxin module